MRSLLFTHDYPPMLGGISSLLSTAWRHAGNDECVILAPRMPGAAAYDARQPIRTVRFPTLRRGGFFAKMVNSASSIVWLVYCTVRFRPEVIVAGQIVRAGPAARLWHKITGRPFYLCVYGGETSADFAGASWAARHLHAVLRDARYILTISPFTSREMIDFGIPRQRIVELPMGVREDVGPGPKDEAYVSRLGLGDKLVFLTIGRLIERKGMDTMLRALAELRDDLPPWHYLLVSDGEYRQTLETMIEDLELSRCVTLTGHVAEHEIPTYYNLCDVFAMPNREVARTHTGSLSVEGFGLVFVEAAACGKPVIGGRSGGAVDAIDDGVNGFLVNPGDLDGLKAAILRLCDPQTRRTMGRAGIEFADRFRWETTADLLRPLLAELPPGEEP